MCTEHRTQGSIRAEGLEITEDLSSDILTRVSVTHIRFHSILKEGVLSILFSE